MKYFGTFLWLVMTAYAALTPTTYYLDTGGSDSNPCSVSLPCLTPQHVAAIPMVAGDTVIVSGTSYVGQALRTDHTSCPNCADGTDLIEGSGAITWKAAPGETPFFGLIVSERAYYIFDGINIDGSSQNAAGLDLTSTQPTIFRNAEIKKAYNDGIKADGFVPLTQTHYHLQSLNIHDSGFGNVSSSVQIHGVYFAGGDYNIIEDCDVHDNVQAGGQSYGMQNFNNTDYGFGAPRPSHNIIRRNKFHGNGAGLYVGTGDHNLVYDNLVYSNIANGIDVTGLTNFFYQNTIYGNGGFGLQFASGTGQIGQNNISFNNGASNIVDFSSGAVLTNNFTADPSFTNAAGGDFTLLSSSGAIAYGTDLSGLGISDLLLDYDGFTRPNPPSAGAYDFGGIVTARLVSVSPISLVQGSTAQTLTLTGASIVFDSSSVVSTACSGVTVNSTALVDPLHVTANVTVAAMAPAASCDITVTTTGQPTVTLTNGFAVTATATPAITSLTPASASQGDSGVVLTVVATDSHFSGSTVVTMTNSTGITIASPTVANATHLTVSLDIDFSVATGARTVTFTTGAEVIDATNSFTVNPGIICGGTDLNGFVQGQCVAAQNGGGDTTLVTPAMPLDTVNNPSHYGIAGAAWCKDLFCGDTSDVHISSITSACGFTYTKAKSSATNLIIQNEIWTAPFTSACSEHVTFNFGGSTVYYATGLLGESYGNATSSPIDATVAANGSSTTPAGSLTTTQNGDLVIAYVVSGGSGVVPTAPLVLLKWVPGNAIAYEVAGAAGSQSLNFTASNNIWSLVAIALKPNTVTPPSITTVSPSSCPLFTADCALTLTGLNTHWTSSSVPTMNDMGGINTISFTRNSATSAIWHFAVTLGASTGSRDVIVTEGSEIATKADGFTVTSPAIQAFYGIRTRLRIR